MEVVDGSLQIGDKVASLASGETYDVSDVSCRLLCMLAVKHCCSIVSSLTQLLLKG